MNRNIQYQYKECLYLIEYVISKRGQRWYKIRTENGETVGKAGNVYTEEDAVDLCQEHYVDTHTRPQRRRIAKKEPECETKTTPKRRRKTRNQEIRNPSSPKCRQSENQDREIGKDLIQIDNYLEFTEPVLDLSDFGL